MRVNAYILAADPAWLRQSVQSYYPFVDSIVVSYDRTGTSSTGTPLEVDACLQALKEIDGDGKMVLSGGDYARLDHKPLDNDTYQRQCALDEASVGADWVLQIDTDEVVGTLPVFIACLNHAERRGFSAMDYPARVLYKQVGATGFLEQSTRLWRAAAGFPGPVAIRAGSSLRLCRQSDNARFRVDFRATNTDPWQSRRSPVHRVIGLGEGILHFSWVRGEEHMLRKSRWSGHAESSDFAAEVERWRRRGRHPLLTVARTPFQARLAKGRLRLVDLRDFPMVADNGDQLQEADLSGTSP